MNIRSETRSDQASIRAVHVASFPTPGEADVVDRLRESRRLSASLVAEVGSEVAGHVAFSSVTLEAGGAGWGLAPLAVLPGHRRQGIGAALVAAGLAVARQAGAGFVVVLGDPDYYGRFGFRPASTWSLADEFGGGAAFQAIELAEGALADVSGLVRYAPEFADLD